MTHVMEWEYQIETIRAPHGDAAQTWLERLNDLGVQGWELVTERWGDYGTTERTFTGTFKRPKA